MHLLLILLLQSAPVVRVDPSWPLEMPNRWIMGTVTSVFVDSRDHVWVTHLPEGLTEEETFAAQKPPVGECCIAAPAVIEFDPQGKVVQAWGDQSQDISVYPRNPHGLFVDHNNFVWIGTYQHHRVQKFTRDGKHLMTIGQYDVNKGSNDTSLLGGPAGIWVDPANNEVFIADGYRNRRVVVFEGSTGKYLRHWGAYGEKPDDAYNFGDRNPAGPPPRQFSTVHGLTGSRDGLIYVADRRGNRIQVFRKSGEFVKEKIVAPNTLASGSAFVIALSPDRNQQWLYLADGTNHKVWILRRESLEIVGSFGRGGRQVGQMLRPHGMGIDSKGNVYVGEASTGRRVQKFTVQAQGLDNEVYEEELATFSIIARDPATGQLGECMTSKALAGGNRAVTALGGVAVIAHQQAANPMYGRIGMELIKMGMAPQDALDFLLRADTAKESRQVAMIDFDGRTAAWTNGGESAGQPGAWRGHKCGTNYCAQGNSLTGPEVVQAVARTFESAKGTLAERMLAAIDAGQAAGGDARGKQTALLVVVRPLTGNNPTSDRVVDFRVDDHPEPLVELRRLLNLNESGSRITQGNTKIEQGDVKGAIELFIQARNLAPTSDNAWIALANGYLRNNQKTEAFNALRKAVELNPNNKKRLPNNQSFQSLKTDPEFLRITGS